MPVIVSFHVFSDVGFPEKHLVDFPTSLLFHTSSITHTASFLKVLIGTNLVTDYSPENSGIT
jgi:hypothetical protein